MPVHHDKPVLLVRLHQLRQRFRVKLVIAQVQRRVDRLERLKVNVHFPLLPLVRDHRAGVHDEPVRGHFRVELETLLGRGDGAQDRLSVHPGFNVRGRPVLGLEHRLGLADLRLWRQDEADHGRPVAFCFVQHFDKLSEAWWSSVGRGREREVRGRGGVGSGGPKDSFGCGERRPTPDIRTRFIFHSLTSWSARSCASAIASD